MKQTKTNESPYINRLTVDIKGLAQMLSCGESTARKIGKESGALIKLGTRSLYHVPTIMEYIESLKGKNEEE